MALKIIKEKERFLPGWEGVRRYGYCKQRRHTTPSAGSSPGETVRPQRALPDGLREPTEVRSLKSANITVNRSSSQQSWSNRVNSVNVHLTVNQQVPVTQDSDKQVPSVLH